MRDPSVRERVAQYRAAWQLTVSSPLVGVGPGHEIEWVDVSGFPRHAFTADTPFVLPAKFGIIGTVIVGLVVAAYGLYVADLVRRHSWTPETLALFGFAVSICLGLPLGMPLEDKAFSFALVLLLAVAIANGRDATPDWAVTSKAADGLGRML
jgi:O-antigen ligase